MVPGCKYYENVSKIPATGIPQPPHILNAGKRIRGVVAYSQITGSNSSADEWACSLLFHNLMQRFLAELKYLFRHKLSP